MHLVTAVNDFLAKGLKGRSKGTVDNYRSLADRNVSPQIGGIRLKKLTADQLDDWLDERAEGDAAATRLIIDAQDGPVVLVGHSYGGAVITEAGTDQKVAAPGLHLCVRAGQGRVGQHAPRRFPGRRAAAADPAAQGRLPVPGPG